MGRQLDIKKRLSTFRKIIVQEEEAADLINEIKPVIAIPIHYGSIVGTKQDAIDFSNLLNQNIKCEILMK